MVSDIPAVSYQIEPQSQIRCDTGVRLLFLGRVQADGRQKDSMCQAKLVSQLSLLFECEHAAFLPLG